MASMPSTSDTSIHLLTEVTTSTHHHRPFSIHGIHRRKHAVRAIFRSVSFLLLVMGYIVYHGVTSAQRYREANDDNVGGVSSRILENGEEYASSHLSGLSGNAHDSTVLTSFFAQDSLTNEELLLLSSPSQAHHQPSLQSLGIHDNHPSRNLQQSSNTTSTYNDNTTQPPCPILPTVSPPTAVALFLGILYTFLALAIVCDEFFVPALEEIASPRHLHISMDVAGATLMAAGGSAPELFTSFVGTFQQSDIGIGTIVGSAVFNVLFVIGVCSMLSREVLCLTWWPLFRDCLYYGCGLAVLSVVVGVSSAGEVRWWEALILLGMYVGYVVIMKYNRRLYKRITGKELVLGSEQEEEEVAGSSSENTEENVHPAAVENGEVAVGSRLNSETSNQLLSHEIQRAMVHTDFRWPGTFRAGVLKLLLHPSSWEDKGGIGIVAKIQGDVEHVFKTVDLNGDGVIDLEELGKLFVKLGHEISHEDLTGVFASLDLDSNGMISEDEFTKWYIKSEERVLSQVRHIFDEFDADKSGSIDRDEVRALLKKLQPGVTESDVDEALTAMYKSGSTEEITFDEFSHWYVNSMIFTKQQQDLEKQIEEEENGVCEALRPPKGEGLFAWLKYLLVLPLVACLTFTIPDVRRPGLGKWCYLSFVLSIVWIGFFSYWMVDWTELLGNTIGIPSVVMGLTLLAAGTSVPDLLSSVIVARMGEGDMAVSSSIGSNIFDILVGLPLPWLCFTMYPKTPSVVVINAQGIWVSICILIGMLFAIVIIIHCQGWKMTRTLGACMFFLYFAYLAQAVVTEYFKNPCFCA
ncbi:hypothetical protein HJC23_005363 [Cyclotella cryptica]|uniref:EF-hand domain-containing protein n=1 Tax=Cyclotella cryptica TaxID=29204 RepID=A0ABD3NNS0_9STRA|eukprot:CCRYP_020240-RA/>CCRYP_020240-RA protein AED:0.04 eAED:0.04 QI:407/1/1/1/0.5/0.33/3/916/804